MAVRLLGADNARVDFGDIAALSGLTAFTVAFTFTPSTTTATNRRFVSQWDSLVARQAFLVQVVDNDEIGFVVSAGDATYFGKKTTGLDLASGSTYRVVCTIAFGGPPTIHIWVNGSDEALADFVGTSNVTQMINSVEFVQVGHETAEAADGSDGDYSEVALWSAVVPDAVAIAYGAGFSPKFWRTSGILYAPLWNTNYVTDQYAGRGAHSGATDAAHPRMYYPATGQ